MNMNIYTYIYMAVPFQINLEHITIWLSFNHIYLDYLYILVAGCFQSNVDESGICRIYHGFIWHSNRFYCISTVWLEIGQNHVLRHRLFAHIKWWVHIMTWRINVIFFSFCVIETHIWLYRVVPRFLFCNLFWQVQ